MTVGFHSPLPPARSGVADYSAALLGALRRYGRVEVAPGRCDIALYHLGNNRLHREIYRRALARPGVVVLHDAVLHHFLLGELAEKDYVDEFVYNYGEWNRGLAGELWRSRATSGADGRYFEYGMLRRACESALAVVVHNPAAGEAVRRHARAARIVEIPHLFAPPAAMPGVAETLRWRAAHGIPPGAFLFGVFGYLRESKRLPSVLAAFGRLRRERPEAMLLVAGDFVSSDLARAVAPLVAAPGIVRTPHLPEREFWTAAAAVDACVNLRYPAAGEASGIAIRLMGLAKPVLLTEGAEAARFPEDACLRIPPGAGETAALFDYMVLLSSMTGAARSIGLRGAGHVRGRHSIETAAREYWKTLCECRSSFSPAR